MNHWLAKRLLGFTEIGCLLVALFLLLSFLERHWWAADLCAHWRLHGSVALILGALILWLLKKWKFALAAVVSALLPVHAFIAPFAHKADTSTGPPSTPALKLMCHNVMSENPHHDRVAASIANQDPDVLILLELRASWNPLVQDLQKKYPHSAVELRDDHFGIALFSRLPMSTFELADFSGYGIPSIVADLEYNGRDITVIATHTVPPMGDAMWRVRNWQMDDLAEFAAEAKEPLIIAGDFNATPWSASVRDFIQTGKLSKANAIVNATWSPVQWPPAGLPIDHIFVSDHWNAPHTHTGSFAGSDHRPVIATLELR